MSVTRQFMFRGLVVSASIALVCAALILLFPRMHVVFGPKSYCRITEIDLNTGDIRRSTFMLWFLVDRKVERTSLGVATRRFGLAKTPPNWVETIISAGAGDNYHAPGAKLLAQASLFNSFYPKIPTTMENQAEFVRKVAQALQNGDHRSMYKTLDDYVDTYLPGKP